MSFRFPRWGQAENPVKTAGFRPDIQGLRALAVLGVLFFHFRLGIFKGGYIGVDIFFVISGYLITRNIWRDTAAGHFSFRDFYARRIRRIFPAMLVTVAAVILAGALWFPPAKFIALAQSSLSSLGFVSNVYFWRLSQQYFAPDSGFLPLLHLWSLSAEEQFYIGWPLVIFLLARMPSRWLFLIVGAIGLAALAVTLLFARIDEFGAFYLVPFRAYQFSIGAFVCFLERPGDSKAAGWYLQSLGLAFCLAGIFAFSSHTTLPGITASLGAGLIIYGGVGRSSYPILTNAAAAYVGRISYSLYLIHWPVAVFANYIFGDRAFVLPGVVLQLVIDFVLAAALYRFVEEPFFTRHTAPRKSLHVRALLTSTILLGIISLMVMMQGGWSWRLNGAERKTERLEAFGGAPCDREATSCTFGDVNGSSSFTLIGDSYAQHYVSALDRIARPLGIRGEEQIEHGCLVLSGLVRLGYKGRRCWTGRDRALAAAKASTGPVIISEAWVGYGNGVIGDDNGHAIDVKDETTRLEVLRQGLERTIAYIDRPGRRILLIGAQVMAPCPLPTARTGGAPLPHDKTPPCQPRTLTQARQVTAGIDNMLASVQARHPGTVSLIKPVDYFCDAICPMQEKNLWLYEDGGHLTVAGSLRFGARAHKVIVDFLEGSYPGQHLAAPSQDRAN